MEEIKILENCIGFQWDAANLDKNQVSHQVSPSECEETFFNKPLLLYEDIKHSQIEQRYYLLGKTFLERKLFIVFTVRKQLIRVISARDMSKKERQIYETATQKTAPIH